MPTMWQQQSQFTITTTTSISFPVKWEAGEAAAAMNRKWYETSSNCETFNLRPRDVELFFTRDNHVIERELKNDRERESERER